MDAEEEEARTERTERQYYLRKVIDGEARNPEQFYDAAAILIRQAHALSGGELDQLADALSKPWKRPGKGAPVNFERDIEIWAECLTFVGTIRRGGKNGDPLPTRSEAIRLIVAKYRIEPDAARKIYDRLRKHGPPNR